MDSKEKRFARRERDARHFKELKRTFSTSWGGGEKLSRRREAIFEELDGFLNEDLNVKT